jgi:hypothetical protein
MQLLFTNYIKKKRDKITTNRNKYYFLQFTTIKMSSSLAGKMSMLVDEYNHSKQSPAYRKLNIKYKALKEMNEELRATNRELVQLLANAFSNMSCKGLTAAPKIKPKNIISKLRERTPEYSAFADAANNHINNEPEVEVVVKVAENIVIEESVVEIQKNTVDETEEDADAVEETEEDVVEETEEVVDDVVEETEEEVVEETEEDADAVEETEEEVGEETEEEVVEETEEEVVEETEEEVVEETEEEVVEETEEEEAGVYEIEVDGVRYYTTGETDGIVYALLEDDDVGDEIGKFVNGKLVLDI